jgi:hypothetical protein
VVLAGQSMSKVLLDTEGRLIYRKGYVIGDGTGIGKGRQIAAIIADNWFQGRTRSVWISCSRSLHQDAIRDFSDLGLAIPVYELGGKGLKWGDLEEQIKAIGQKQGVKSKRDPGGGVIFATYSSLSTTKTGFKTVPRYETILDWLKKDPSGEEGVIAFDEIHKAKNLVPPNPRTGLSSKSSTQVGNAVHQMQLRVPNCRILYSSATGMSRPKAIAPFMRLGLWNDGPAETSTTPFTSFHDFMAVISPGRESQSVAMGRMEIVARTCFFSLFFLFFFLLSLPLLFQQTRTWLSFFCFLLTLSPPPPPPPPPVYK